MKKIITILLIAAASSCYSQVKPLDTIYKKIVHTYYFTSWNDTGHVANYSFYMLTKKQMKGPELPRAFTFQIDPLNPVVVLMFTIIHSIEDTCRHLLQCVLIKQLLRSVST